MCCLRELVSRLPPDARDVTLIAPGDNAKARQQEPTLPVSNLRPVRRLARAAQCVENVERVTRKVDVFNGALPERHSRVAPPLEVLNSTCAQLWRRRWRCCSSRAYAWSEALWLAWTRRDRRVRWSISGKAGHTAVS